MAKTVNQGLSLAMGVALGISLSMSGLASVSAIPPSQFILKTWIAKHKGIKSVRVKSTVTAYDQDQPLPVQFTELAVFQLDGSSSKEGRQVKSWALDSEGKKLYSSSSSLSSSPLATRLLFGLEAHEVAEGMRAKGIAVRSEAELLTLKTESDRLNAEMVSFGRLEQKGKSDPDKTVAWIIGAGEIIQDSENFKPKESKPIREGNVAEPQAWFEKDTFLLVRLVYSALSGSSQSGDLFDFKFQNMRFHHEFPYPRTIRVGKKGTGTLLEVKVEEISVNSPENSTGTAEFKSLGRPSLHSGFTEVGEAASSSLKELIRSYYGLFRSN